SWAARACSGVAILSALWLGGPAPQVAAQEAPAPASSDPPRPHKSGYGKLSRVDQSLNGGIMRAGDGQKLAWRFDKRVIAEAAKFKTGDPMIVIYRQISPSEKRGTALAFPGSAAQRT